MRVFKIYLYKLQTKKRNSLIYFAHTSLSFSEKFSIMFENDVVSLMWCFTEIRAFEFFTARSSNIIYQKFSFFFLNFFFKSSFIFIFVDFSSTFIVFLFSFSFHSFTAMLQHWAEKSFRQFVLSFLSNVFKEDDSFAEIVSLKIKFNDWCRKYIFY